MDSHRLVAASEYSCIDFAAPFSCFKFIESNYGDSTPIRRLFSLARSLKAKTLVIEKIPPVGIIADENNEIETLCNAPDHQMVGLDRVSFWDSAFSIPTEETCKNDNLLGYAILKHDVVPSRNSYDHWHVFEAVFIKYPHPHNFIPNPSSYSVRLIEKVYVIQGLLYAQQNSLNKACAQVALRSIISRIRPPDISYRQINDFAKQSIKRFNPQNGLHTTQIRNVLNGFGIPFRDMDYTKYDHFHWLRRYLPSNLEHLLPLNMRIRNSQPYHAYLYAGIESGVGALVGFRCSGGRHIIPFYGHTFNKDTWATDAEINYFSAGGLGYIPSQNWTSSFLGHDDNFGANYCVPRLYMSTSQIDYVVELLKPNFRIRGAQAEGLSLQLLYSIIDQIDTSDNEWLKRLILYKNNHEVVLRAIAVERDTYINHIKHEKDWDGHSELPEAINLFSTKLPDSFWVVEISVPQLFPANERKLGDVVVNGRIDLDLNHKYKHLLYVRLPGGYYMLRPSTTEVSFFPSNFTSHLNVLKLNKEPL